MTARQTGWLQQNNANKKVKTEKKNCVEGKFKEENFLITKFEEKVR